MLCGKTFSAASAWAALPIAIAVLAVGAGASTAPSAIRGEGEVKSVAARDVIQDVMSNSPFASGPSFPPTIVEIVPEWSYVERGAVIARLQTPLLGEDRADAAQRIRVAEATALQTEAEARAALGDLESALVAAREGLRGAEERLAALKALPSAADKERMAARIEANDVRRGQASDGLAMLQELARDGLCSEAELREARHEGEKCEAEARYLAAALAQLEKQGDSFEVRRAELEVRKLKAELAIAEVRMDLESRRSRLTCDAARLAQLGQARRALDLTNRRLEALTVRSPAAGYVLHGYRQWYWPHLPGQPYVPGKPIYYGQVIASIIDPAQVRIEAEIREEELLGVRTGDRVEVKFPAVAGQVYEGAVEAVLPIVRALRWEAVETATQAQRRYGVVHVTLARADERVRPGMRAAVSIFPGGPAERSPKDEQGDSGARGEPPTGRPDLVLWGELGTRSRRYVAGTLKGRVTWLAPTGALIQKGEVIARLEAGLEEDWQAKDEAELERLTYLHQAAELQVRLKEQLVPLLRERAEADVALAELDCEELKARPEEPERLKAQNELADAEWQSRSTGKKLVAYRELAARTWASGADVREAELQVARARAGTAMARARLAEVASGASGLERAIAQAGVQAARTSLEKVNVLADSDAAAARAGFDAAGARLEAYRAQADRRRRRAEQAEVKSPVSGIVIGSWVKEGQEVEAGSRLAEVADMQQAVVYAMLDESDYRKVRPGAPARVRLAGVPGRLFAGRVSEIVDWPELPVWYRRSLSEGRTRPSKLFRAVVELDEEPPACVGMSATVEILSPPAGQAAGRVSRGDEEPREGAADGRSD